MKILQNGLIGSFATAVVIASCSSGACPTIACQPEVDVSFQTPVPGNYSLSVTLAGHSFSAACPMQTAQVPGIESCDGNSFVVAGVDLGNGQNDTVAVTASINGGATIDGTATLTGITNSRSCETICFVHMGTINN